MSQVIFKFHLALVPAILNFWANGALAQQLGFFSKFGGDQTMYFDE